MRKIKIFLIITIVIMLTGCKDYGEKRIVKLLSVDQNYVSVYYYDYSKKEVEYLKEEKEYGDIGNALTEILGEEKYDLKLCQYAVVDSDVVENHLKELFFALTNSKFSPDISIIEVENIYKAEEYIKHKMLNYPVYTYKINQDTISGIVDNPDTKEKHIIISDKIYKTLTPQQSFVFDIINKKMNNGIYSFEENEKKYAVNLENIDVFYYVKDRTLYMQFSANIKSYKGAPSGEPNKSELRNIVVKSMRENIQSLLEDNVIEENFNLLWYRNVNEFDNIKLDIKLD